MEQCLWVRDAKQKQARGYNKGLDPESVRCNKDGHIFCKPCWGKFFGEKNA